MKLVVQYDDLLKNKLTDHINITEVMKTIPKKVPNKWYDHNKAIHKSGKLCEENWKVLTERSKIKGQQEKWRWQVNNEIWTMGVDNEKREIILFSFSKIFLTYITVSLAYTNNKIKFDLNLKACFYLFF